MDKKRKEIEKLAYFNWKKDSSRTADENWYLAEKQWLKQQKEIHKPKIKLENLYTNNINNQLKFVLE